jgi:hypothetical protein
VTAERIAVSIQKISLRRPEIVVLFVVLCLLRLRLQGREAFGFLVSPSPGITRHIRTFATREKRGARR